ncbi:MAG TPA: PEP/pyruvate-binding domain-containing protein, partial [Actinomycetota bacterium]|nr:PEP/pyruvate-binding domain-containing protein [Actinomycetota bacterium]
MRHGDLQTESAAPPDVVVATPMVFSLGEIPALDASIAGAKATALARATRAGLPVLPGFVIGTTTTARIHAAGGLDRAPSEILETIRAAWKAMSHDGRRKLVVRSSSTAEDGDDSSMAGMFSSILDVSDWGRFLAAVNAVIESGKVIHLEERQTGSAPLAVLVQPQLDAAIGGILFGVDPVTGGRDRVAVVATEGGPDVLVSGLVEGTHYSLTHGGRVLERKGSPDILSRGQRHALTTLAGRAARHFGGPQDMEWAFDADGKLHLFQSRPVTAVGQEAVGPIMGPGPVAETFPNVLSRLEQDLWVAPLRKGIVEALLLTGSAARGAVRRSPVVAALGGRVAADLDLFGIAPRKRGLFEKLSPVEPARRMVASWRVGRLKAALPVLAGTLVEDVDSSLAKMPAPHDLTNEQLLTAVLRAQRYLVSLHGYEVLAGILEDEEGTSGASLALRALAIDRSEGFSDEEIVANHPEVLALVPPRIDGSTSLPETPPMSRDLDPAGTPGPREALRLRVRWVQELSARCAWEIGRRMIPAGHVQSPEDIRKLSLPELQAMVTDGVVPGDLGSRLEPVSAPLPAAFRMTIGGVPVPVRMGDEDGAGKGAGGGRGMGRVRLDGVPTHGEVL